MTLLTDRAEIPQQTPQTPQTRQTRETPQTAAQSPAQDPAQDPAQALVQSPAWQARARAEAVQRYRDQVDEETVSACFDAALRQLAGARVTDFLPVLVERRLREVLGRRGPGAVPSRRPDAPQA